MKGRYSFAHPASSVASGPTRFAREQIVERDTVLLGLPACSSGDLQRAAGEAAHCFAPDRVIKAHGHARRTLTRGHVSLRRRRRPVDR